MHGLGNDFVVLDARKQALPLGSAAIRHMADRRFGIGCDQLIVLEADAEADIRMRIFNPDGGEVGACGNATRCIGALLMDETGADEVAIGTLAGVLKARRAANGAVSVDMGVPRLTAAEIPLAIPVADTMAVPLLPVPDGFPGPFAFSAVSMGNPHAVFFVPDCDTVDLGRWGPILEQHPLFPERANISFATVERADLVRLRVWERAAGVTLACGTAACAAAVAGVRVGLVERVVRVRLPGGALRIEWRADGRVQMEGPATIAYRGEIALPTSEGGT